MSEGPGGSGRLVQEAAADTSAIGADSRSSMAGAPPVGMSCACQHPFLVLDTHLPWLQWPTHGLDAVVHQPGYGHVTAQGVVRGEPVTRWRGRVGATPSPALGHKVQERRRRVGATPNELDAAPRETRLPEGPWVVGPCCVENSSVAYSDSSHVPLLLAQVSIKGQYAGRIEFVLFARESPLWAETFYLMCTGG